MVDLSWPRGKSTNDGIASGEYLGDVIVINLSDYRLYGGPSKKFGKRMFYV